MLAAARFESGARTLSRLMTTADLLREWITCAATLAAHYAGNNESILRICKLIDMLNNIKDVFLYN